MKKNSFLAFIQKESLHILRDKRTMLIVLLIPVVLMILFGFAISTEINNLNIAVVAPNKTVEVDKMVQKIANNPSLTFVGYIEQNDMHPTLRTGKADAVVVFASDFDRIMMNQQLGINTEKAYEFVFDASNSNVSAAGAAYLQGVLLDMGNNNLFTMKLLYNPQMKSSYNFVPGIMGLIFILICAMMTSVSIVREKEMGSMEVLLVSPVKPLYIIIAKMIPYLVLSCINLVTILLIAYFLLDVPMTGGVGNIILVSFVYLMLSLALGLLISNISSSQVMALLISAMVLMMPMMMLSGMVFPLENLPAVIKPLTYIVPARWYIEAMRKLMIMGVPLSGVIKELTILSVMAIGLMAVSIKKFNNKLE